MAVTITPLVTVGGVVDAWTIRSGQQHTRYGDPYTTSGVVVRKPREVAEVEALAGPTLCRREVEELKALLRPEGISCIKWERYRKDGATHTAWINIR